MDAAVQITTCIIKNPDKYEHHYVGSNSLCNQSILVFWRYAFHKPVLCKIVRQNIDQNCNVDSVICVRIWLGASGNKVYGQESEKAGEQSSQYPKTHSAPG